MAEDRIIPHIIIGADAGLTDWLIDRLRETVKPNELPFVFSFSALWNARRIIEDRAAAVRDPSGRSTPPERGCLHFVPLIRHLLASNEDGQDRFGTHDVLVGFKEELRRVRSHFGLTADQQLKVVVVGSHSSISDNLKLCDTRIETSALGYEKWRPNRQLAARLGAALERIGGVQLEWLADVAPELVPREPPPDPDLTALAGRAREYLERLGRSSSSRTEPASKLGALPLLYVRDKPSEAWRRFGDGEERPVWRTTLRLIGQFAEARRKVPGLEGILAKVHPEVGSGLNVADALLLTAEQRSAAQGAGLSAILLDRHHGVVCPDGRPGLPIYAV